MHHPGRALSVAVAATGLLLAGCESDQEISPDPDGLEAPADDPEGSGEDDGLEDAEGGTGEPAIEGDGEGRLSPEDEDDEE